MLILKLKMDYKSDFRKFFNKIRKNNQMKINEFLELQFCDALFMGFSQFHERIRSHHGPLRLKY